MAGIATIRGDALSLRDQSSTGELPQRLPATLQPHPNLLRYYLLAALVFGPGWIVAVLPFYFRYRTLRYDLDGEGITMRWGILFRREVSLTYARIQDIQLTSNVVERWLGLARIQLQTASGSASAEMTIEGLRLADGLRDFLYSRMRGAADAKPPRAGLAAATPAVTDGITTAAMTEGNPLAASAEVSDDLGLLIGSLDAAASELRALRIQMSRDGRP
jgi:membrane protein YdbS with pleckstrin-like domain